MPRPEGATAGRARATPKSRRVANVPDALEREEHVELSGFDLEAWLRRLGLFLLAAFLAVGLTNIFGQATGETSVENDVARLTVRAPGAVRSGLFYQVMFRIDARQALDEPAIVLDPGWVEGFTINTYQPDPVEWQHRDGRNVLVYGPIEAGGHLVARLQYQVNTTAVGPRVQNIVLEDGGVEVLRLDHDSFVFP
jgi:hypothetical protein